MIPERIDDRIRREILKEEIKIHHTTSDWDFQSTGWTLDTTYYTSTPSSLKLTTCTGALLKAAVSGALSQGRIIDNLYFYRSRGIGVENTWIFRDQKASGYALDDGYALSLRGSASAADQPMDQGRFYRWVGGSGTLVQTETLNPTLSQSTWYKTRITWWESSGVLIVRLEYWDGSAYTPLTPDFADPQNLYSGNPTNRVGVGRVALYTHTRTCHDDTEIWQKT